MAGLRQLAERSLRKFAGPVYRMLQRRSGQRLAKRFATAEDRFKHIYETNHWDEAESVSGPGSTLEETEPIRRELPALLAELGASSLLDLPCGDFHFMSRHGWAPPKFSRAGVSAWSAKGSGRSCNGALANWTAFRKTERARLQFNGGSWVRREAAGGWAWDFVKRSKGKGPGQRRRQVG